MMGSGFGLGFGIPGLGMLLFWGLLILGLLWLVRSLFTRSGSGDHFSRSPREILDERFARGEIDEAEYGRKRKQLS